MLFNHNSHKCVLQQLSKVAEMRVKIIVYLKKNKISLNACKVI